MTHLTLGIKPSVLFFTCTEHHNYKQNHVHFFRLMIYGFLLSYN